ncbi:MAG: MoaD/ThiS family protein [Chloroflexi bacterium]|nr:MoaD/ThiS family protein [Chloroflexota bacterium]
MGATVKIPTPLRNLTGGAKEVVAEGATVSELIDDLERQHPGLKDRLCDESGDLRRFVNVYVGGEDIRFLDGLATAIQTGSDISIVPAVAGG